MFRVGGESMRCMWCSLSWFSMVCSCSGLVLVIVILLFILRVASCLVLVCCCCK